MPKRVIDGEALWTSRKLALVVPLSFRAEYANLIPLAEWNGSFEAEPRLVWRTVYAANRPDITSEQAEQILAEFVRVKMLYLWEKENGLKCGFFIGINKPGRLPSPSRINGKHYKSGPEVPYEDLARFLGEAVEGVPSGYLEGTHSVQGGQPGIGTGTGFGLVEVRTESGAFAYTGMHLSISVKDDRAFACAFPKIDRQAEYRKADAWIEVNPAKRPRKQRSFVYNWLARIPKDTPVKRTPQVRELVVPGPRGR